MHAIRLTLKPVAAALAVAAATLLMPAAHAQVAKVNGVVIPQARMDVFLKVLAANKQPDTPETRSRVREELITQEILSQEAVRKGMDKNAELAAQIDMQRQQALAQAYVQDYMKANPVSDDAMRKEYERVLKLASPGKEYRARHILVEKEDEAKDLLAQIKKGASFEKLAAGRSKDPGSKTTGGDLDWSPAMRYAKPFGDALTKMKKGQLLDTPVQTEFGWHVIRLDDERTTKVPSFDEAKPQIQQQMQVQNFQKMLSDLRAKAKVE